MTGDSPGSTARSDLLHEYLTLRGFLPIERSMLMDAGGEIYSNGTFRLHIISDREMEVYAVLGAAESGRTFSTNVFNYMINGADAPIVGRDSIGRFMAENHDRISEMFVPPLATNRTYLALSDAEAELARKRQSQLKSNSVADRPRRWWRFW